MKNLPMLVFVSLLLSGCTAEFSDLKLYVSTIQAQHVAHIPPLRKTPKFEHFDYQAELLRSPFAPPLHKMTDEELASNKKNCLKPDFKRKKERLEAYPLANLKMRGSLVDKKNVWALLEETNQRNVYRIGVGEYLGIYNGKITKVTQESVEVVELIPDGSGCWTERATNIKLASK